MASDERSKPLPRIRRLDENVVNRIAAGEIIQRPANAIKELLENSLDAGSSSITITIKEGGLKLLQIQDNGHGISVEDMPIVCERFTTSKLRQFKDLESIATYGFRGEALASISHVAHVIITTRTSASPCAYRASFADGKLVASKPGASVDPKPVAGNVEDLFFNMDVRRKAVKNTTEEYNRIVDVVQRYAIHNSGVSFTCKKHGSNTADVHTASGASTIDNIRYMYGAQLAKELLDFKHESEILEFTAEGYVSNANFNQKKMVFLLFINHRLVESSNIRKALESLYGKYLPKGQHPFVYMSLTVKPQNVDVNVHPTKREVHILREDKIVETLCQVIEERLASASSSRTYHTQTLLPVPAKKTKQPDEPEPKKAAFKTPANKMVRTDSKTRTLDAYLSAAKDSPNTTTNNIKKRTRDDDFENEESRNSRESTLEDGRMETDDDFQAPEDKAPSVKTKRPYTEVRLTSILSLREEVKKTSHQGLTDLFRNYTYVGRVDEARALFQHQTALFMVNFQEASCELFYQLVLRVFSNFGFMHLATRLSIHDMVMIGLDEEERIGQFLEENDITKDEIANKIVETLVDRRQMLLEYFSIKISEDGELLALPAILKGYTPNLDKLPLFFVRCQSEVNWTSEKECFQSIARELSLLYAVEAVAKPRSNNSTQNNKTQGNSRNDDHDVNMDSAADDVESVKETEESNAERDSHQWMIEHVLFPAFRNYFQAPKSFVDNGVIVRLATLPDLYRVFERC
ncbi:hypothetical protein SmJEL517_g04461 [Synchytrium microbalum]|uniref:DNA mismatch repair protein S5 domain-containing protein n=1 Tax=Synchytrium microbalum TaxID=1806994 RepID=A0A507BRZ2_9FUNG|nr:uncharacterized protein SmJEL517_g04461 [Synchytrium microbalum]TPX32420.1 hypothetical protein SmJEL517_g04461 [Synchytrium microbalum]